MKPLMATALLLALLASSCVGDAQVTVYGVAKKGASCVFTRYNGNKLVEAFPVSGQFKETYAVSVATKKRVEIICAGKVVAKEDLTVAKGNVDLGYIPH